MFVKTNKLVLLKHQVTPECKKPSNKNTEGILHTSIRKNMLWAHSYLSHFYDEVGNPHNQGSSLHKCDFG
jgi:hypothetical protein